MQELYNAVKAKKRPFWFITLGYITFNGCFLYPFNIMIQNSTSMLFAFIIAYGIIGLFFVGLVRKRILKVYLLTLIFTAIGMVLRYLLEYGEVSNTVNFTMPNTLLSLFAIPSFVALVYWLLHLNIQIDDDHQ